MAPARTNLLLQPASTGRHSSADTADWTGVWVAVGFAGQLTETGAILPATIGHHAIHVRRSADGLTAAFNARPFGGCMSVPVHCAATHHVRCPHLACAFSADSGVLDSTTDPGGRARAEFTGDGRRRVELPLVPWGPLLLVNVTLELPAPPAAAGAPPPGPVVAAGSRPASGDWLTAPLPAAAAAAETSGGTPVTVAPNLTIVRHRAGLFVALGRPAGPSRSTVVWAECGPTHAGLNGEETDTEPR